MIEGMPCVKILDLATNRQWYYDLKTRCAKNPKHMHARSEYMTEQTAFTRCKKLSEAIVDDVVFVETIDKFYSQDSTGGQFIPGLNVWRKSKIIEHTVYPGKRGESGRQRS